MIPLNSESKIKQMFNSINGYFKYVTFLDSAIFFANWLRKNNFDPCLVSETDLSLLIIKNGDKVKLVYEYCLSGANIHELAPEKGMIIVNLHDFNGEGGISGEALCLGDAMEIKIFRPIEFYRYCHSEK